MLGVVIPTSPVLSVWVLLDVVARSSMSSSALWRDLRGGKAGPQHPVCGLAHSPGIGALLSSADLLLCQGVGLGATEDGCVPLPWCYMPDVSPCSLPALPTHPGCGVRASIGQGKSWACSGPPLSGQGWGGLALLVDEEQLPCNGRSPKRQ